MQREQLQIQINPEYLPKMTEEDFKNCIWVYSFFIPDAKKESFGIIEINERENSEISVHDIFGKKISNYNREKADDGDRVYFFYENNISLMINRKTGRLFMAQNEELIDCEYYPFCDVSRKELLEFSLIEHPKKEYENSIDRLRDNLIHFAFHDVFEPKYIESIFNSVGVPSNCNFNIYGKFKGVLLVAKDDYQSGAEEMKRLSCNSKKNKLLSDIKKQHVKLLNLYAKIYSNENAGRALSEAVPKVLEEPKYKEMNGLKWQNIDRLIDGEIEDENVDLPIDVMIDGLELFNDAIDKALEIEGYGKFTQTDLVSDWVKSIYDFWIENFSAEFNHARSDNGIYHGATFDVLKSLADKTGIKYTDRQLLTAIERCKSV